MIKVGIIGMGGMGTCHYNEYKSIEDVKVVAVADILPDVAKGKIGTDDVVVYPSLEEMFKNEELDLIDVCVPTYAHAEVTIAALEYGAHVMCEKPMALSLTEAKTMFDAAKKSDKFFMTAHVVRFFAAYRYLKEVIDSKKLGKVVSFEMKRLSTIPDWSHKDWLRDRSKSGGSLLDLSIHDYDFVQYVFGMPKDAHCTYHKMKNNNDFVVSTLIYDEMFATITSGFYNCDMPFKAEFLAIFENGYIECNGDTLMENGENIDISNKIKNEDTGLNISNTSGYQTEIRYFTDCIKQNKAPQIVTPESALATMELYEILMNNCKEV